MSYVFYERHCTALHGKAVGYATDTPHRANATPNTQLPEPTYIPDSENGERSNSDLAHDVTAPHVELAEKRAKVLTCLQDSDMTEVVSIKVHVSKRGTPQTLTIAEDISTPAKECILTILKSVFYPSSSSDYVVDQTYRRTVGSRLSSQ